MVGLGILFGLVVLLAGVLIMAAFITGGYWMLAVGFVLLALCSIFGVRPDFLAKTRD